MSNRQYLELVDFTGCQIKPAAASPTSASTRARKDRCGVSVDDIAKRLSDYGLHAPTMSFPVAGTLMIEPTESASKAEIARFCEAMIGIRREIAEVEAGRFKIEESPLRHAPHTVHDVVDAEWKRPYSREEAVFPEGVSRTEKYWCPVGRVGNVYGDRNLVCICPMPDGYPDEAAWAQRLKRVFGIDVTTCTRCGGAVRIVASIEEPKAIQAILAHFATHGALDEAHYRPAPRAPPAVAV